MSEFLLIPEHDPDALEMYPGNIQPGRYSLKQVVELLRCHKHDAEAIQFIADMLEP